MCNACEKPKYYITTAIAYASSKPHIGNVYDIIMADAIARYKRQRGFDVFLCTGTDEHGQKIELKAEEAGITPKQFVDHISAQIQEIWDGMNVSYDRFIRTTDADHEAAISHIFQKFYDQGDIYKSAYEGWYCTPCESFFTDTQLVNGKCPDCGREVNRAQEEAYFFRMSKYADWLIDYIESHPGFIEPEARQKEMINNFLKPGLQDLCITRSNFRWGIPVPFDQGHVTYVWLDALCNYITALGYDPANPEQPERFQKFWPANVHIIGKDIMRFHSIYWTIFLHALGLPLPEKIFGHPWFKFGEDKMSKSRGNVIYSDELATHFTVDGVRYYALAEMPYLNDGSITYESMINRYNTDLANNLGNLVNRTIAMTKKYFDGMVPTPGTEEGTDAELKTACRTAVNGFVQNMESFHLADACSEIFTMLRRANKYIDETTPWTLAKSADTLPRLRTVIYNLLEVIRTGAVLLTSLLPQTAQSIFHQLGTTITDFDSVSDFGALESEKPVGDAVPLFQRIDEEALIAEWNAKQEAAKAALAVSQPVEKPEGVAQIGIDDFMTVELRTAQIIACEKIPKAKKLLKLQVDLGYEKRQVVSGIAKFYEPDALIGKKIILVANLKPAVLCGIESNGMILASGEKEVRVVFLSEDTPLGERVR